MGKKSTKAVATEVTQAPATINPFMMTFADVKLGQAFTLATDDFAYIKSGNSSAICATYLGSDECRIEGKERISKKALVIDVADITAFIKNRLVTFRQVPQAEVSPKKEKNAKKSKPKSKKGECNADFESVVA